MRTTDLCLCENKCADQLCSNCTADQHICFHDRDNPSSNYVQNFKILAFFCGCIGWFVSETWSEILKTGFLMLWLMSSGLEDERTELDQILYTQTVHLVIQRQPT